MSAKWIGMDTLKAAIRRNPQKAAAETRRFLTDSMASYKRGINNDPWRVGGTGGGVPVSNDPRYPRRYQRAKSGGLRDSHRTEVQSLMASIFPTAPYAKYVHDGTARMAARPWLEYVKGDRETEVMGHAYRMLEAITADLAK
jgi:hypothetical protein